MLSIVVSVALRVSPVEHSADTLPHPTGSLRLVSPYLREHVANGWTINLVYQAISKCGKA
jgi:hypothetical protein